jgi:hypothetical protein
LSSWGSGLSFGLSWFEVGRILCPDEAAYAGGHVSPNGISDVLIVRSHGSARPPHDAHDRPLRTPKIKSTVAAV